MKTNVIAIRRYARSRLYDAAGERYVSLEQLRAWRGEGIALFVIDADSGADVTASVFAGT